jgi:iron-sulfur cluster assembly accessory protein
MIHLSQAAAAEIRRLQLSRQQPNTFLRLSVKTGGCSGLYYSFELEKESASNDRIYEHNGITIVVDERSDRYLQDLKLDYSEDLMGGGFRFHNTQASNTCSCGNSFTIPS